MTPVPGPIVFDRWTPLAYKDVLPDPEKPGQDWMAPQWVGAKDRRRLHAYKILTSYKDNAARIFKALFAEDKEEQDEASARREYGDGDLFIRGAVSALLGDSQTIAVENADKFEEGNAKTEEFRFAAQRQDELRQWALDDRFKTKVIETEIDAVGLADGVYTVQLNKERERATLLLYDPGHYFPVGSTIVDGYPTRVHFAWELTEDEIREKYGPSTDVRQVIHKITYDLRTVPSYRVPWRDKPTTKKCFMTEAEWILKKGVRSVDDFGDSTASYMVDADGKEIRDKDLGIDFMPVVHITNSVSEKELFGESILLRILQILDDIHDADTDTHDAAALTGGPMLAVSGANPGDEIKVGPRRALKLTDTGKAEMLSGAEGVGALRDHGEHLRDLAAINARIPSAQLGRVKPGEASSGIELMLAFSPLRSLIDGEMRPAREDKYRMLLRFVQRLMILGGYWQAPVVPAELVFGSYMPVDRAAIIDQVVKMVQGGVISLQTGLRELQQVGVDIEDVEEEIQLINARDFDAADRLFTATGDEKLVGKFLGVKISPDARPDPSQVPGQNPAQPPEEQK